MDARCETPKLLRAAKLVVRTYQGFLFFLWTACVPGKILMKKKKSMVVVCCYKSYTYLHNICEIIGLLAAAGAVERAGAPAGIAEDPCFQPRVDSFQCLVLRTVGRVRSFDYLQAAPKSYLYTKNNSNQPAHRRPPSQLRNLPTHTHTTQPWRHHNRRRAL